MNYNFVATQLLLYDFGLNAKVIQSLDKYLDKINKKKKYLKVKIEKKHLKTIIQTSKLDINCTNS